MLKKIFVTWMILSGSLLTTHHDAAPAATTETVASETVTWDPAPPPEVQAPTQAQAPMKRVQVQASPAYQVCAPSAACSQASQYAASAAGRQQLYSRGAPWRPRRIFNGNGVPGLRWLRRR